MPIQPCVRCRILAPIHPSGVCEVCLRRLSIANLVELLIWIGTLSPRAMLVGLEALAELLIERGRIIRRFRQELREAEREMQAAGRAGYEDGREDRRGREE